MSVSAGEIVPLTFDALREVAYTAITGTFAAVGGPFLYSGRILKCGNTTNGDLDISFDGTTLQDRLPPNSFALYDFSTNHASPGFSAMGEQVQIYVRTKSGSPALTTGYFYVSMVHSTRN
jgi:hypothetical protein